MGVEVVDMALIKQFLEVAIMRLGVLYIILSVLSVAKRERII